MAPQSDLELKGLKEIKNSVDEYLHSPEGNNYIKEFLKNVDDETLLQFLRGRKCNADYAWETLKRNSEVRLIKYPEIFPKVVPQNVASIRHTKAFTVLRHRDDKGRRIIIFDSREWDVDKHTIKDFVMFGVHIMEKLLRDEDAMKNGIIGIHDSTALGFRHIRQYSVKTIKQIVAVFWHSYPIRYKTLYSVNTPYMLTYAIQLAMYFFPKKLKERLVISSHDKGYSDIHKAIPTAILPKFLGGDLEYEDAVDPLMTIEF